jgi:hypothetical protein
MVKGKRPVLNRRNFIELNAREVYFEPIREVVGPDIPGKMFDWFEDGNVLVTTSH